MKLIRCIIILIGLGWASVTFAQDPEYAFHAGAKSYIGGDISKAKSIVNDALKYNPTDPKLNDLLKMLEEKEKQNKDQQKQNDQQNQEDQQDQEKGDQTEETNEEQQKQQQKPENGEPEGQDEQNENPEENDNEEQMAGNPQQVEDQKISKEKAMMILEAMRNNEIQYIQQQRKKAQPKQDNRPDW